MSHQIPKPTPAKGREIKAKIARQLAAEGFTGGAPEDTRRSVAIDGVVYADFSKICKALGRNMRVVVSTLVSEWNEANRAAGQHRLAKQAEELGTQSTGTGSNRPSCGSSNTQSHSHTSGKT